ncbi:tautomerase family protein [Neobacillus pocheonensis]|uniref:Tautomerase family protein n=1 Tax=Neobacillus pocheonensis TaxID=363869 RepID=A0ABT0WHX7_9BACI|nr:tautomerase family protein [Neobacillus pocheonensis]
MKEITDVIAANLDVPVERVRILLLEIPSENWIVGGETIN